jgi:DnaJ-class molecular chaperone
MASDLANNMSSEDKDALQNMDMEQMISHVTKNVFKMMNNVPQARESSESESENEQDCIYPKTKDICFDLNVDLEDFYTGKKKKLNVKRKRIVEVDGKQTVVEEKKKLIIPIEKGMKDEQQIRFEGEADQIPGYKPGDIVITLIENEHPFFQRDGDNLIIIKNINLYQIYTLSFDIKHLDSRVLRIKNDDSDALHLNESLRKITGEGMPVYKGNGDYGDLFIRFNIVIPKSLDKNKLGMLKNVFNDPVQDSEVVYDSVNENCTLEHVSETDIEYLESDESETDDEESDDSSDDSLSESSEESESDQSESSEESEPRVKKSLKKKL